MNTQHFMLNISSPDEVDVDDLMQHLADEDAKAEFEVIELREVPDVGNLVGALTLAVDQMTHRSPHNIINGTAQELLEFDGDCARCQIEVTLKHYKEAEK